LNGIPQQIRNSLSNAESRGDQAKVLKELKTKSFIVDVNRMIWCYPELVEHLDSEDEKVGCVSDSGSSQRTTGNNYATAKKQEPKTGNLASAMSLKEFEKIFPDPKEFCFGVYVCPPSDCQQPLTRC
jgi:hypothetical protein